MRTTLKISLAVLLVAVAGTVVWLQAATQPMIGLTAATPAYIVVNIPTSVVVTARIIDPSLLPGGVNLLKVDDSGKTLIVGVMHDDGLNGDLTANDRLF